MAETVHSVSDITADIRSNLEGSFHGVWIEGEVSNHREPGSGHHYFTLKDHFAQLSCVLFKGAAAKIPVQLKNGLQVQIFGNISVYEARGQYQLIAQNVQLKGQGDLQARFEALKRKLEEEGLFAQERKQPIPVFPRRIGIVTSPTGAAIRDMLNVFARRAPWLEILVYPARVQGDEAAAEIAEGVRFFDEAESEVRPDLVIVARGGGSIEDLWSFNEEIVARAIAGCSLPVMSGVGHEIDFTIADFVADRREPTPSAAAENAAPDGETLYRHLDRLKTGLDSALESELALRRRELNSHFRELQAREPGRQLQSWIQSVDFLGERLNSILNAGFESAEREFRIAADAFEKLHPEKLIAGAHDDVVTLGTDLNAVVDRSLDSRARELLSLKNLMNSLSPDAVLKRGFSITTDEEGQLIRGVGQVSKGTRLKTKLSDGEVTSVVE